MKRYCDMAHADMLQLESVQSSSVQNSAFQHALPCLQTACWLGKARYCCFLSISRIPSFFTVVWPVNVL